jgi:hypothetical protein
LRDGIVFEAAPEPLFHPLGQRATAGIPGRQATRCAAKDRDDGTDKHGQEAEDTDNRDSHRTEREHDPDDEQQQAQHGQRDSLAPVRASRPGWRR